MAGINPFKPNYPVTPGMFVGRTDELDRLEAQLIQTRAGNPANFIITGERGIGKSSLLMYLKFVAEGEIPIGEANVKFLVVDTDIDESTTQLGLVQKIELGIRKQLGQSDPARVFLAEVWGFLQRIEAAGFKIAPLQKGQADELLLEEFSYSLARLAERLCGQDVPQAPFATHHDGILILIDEADNASKGLQLGSFLKLLMERLHRRECSRVMIGLAGLPELPRVLMTSHPSAIRLFDELHLGRLSTEEVSRFITLALEEAEQANEIATEMTEPARQFLVLMSEGYPHFIQQFGYSAFAADVDNSIDEEDAHRGAFGPLGAMELIGERYYRDAFYNKVQKDSYRQVLRIMADQLDGWVTKPQIRARFKGKTSILDNAIHALRERGIILSKVGEKGVYRLQHKGFALWMKMYTTDPSALQRSLEIANGEAPDEGEARDSTAPSG